MFASYNFPLVGSVASEGYPPVWSVETERVLSEGYMLVCCLSGSGLLSRSYFKNVT